MYIFGSLSSYISEVIEICESTSLTDITLIDNTGAEKRKSIDGYKIVQLSSLHNSEHEKPYVICLHTPNWKEIIIHECASLFFTPCSVTHKAATISKRAAISQKGVVIASNVVVGSHSTIADFVLINRGALIGHNVQVDKLATIESGVILGGFCHVGEKSYIGMGATIFPKVIVGSNCVVAAGAVVREDVGDNCMVAGVPAQIKKEHIHGYRGE